MLPPRGACDPCRKKKVKCYGLPPPCTRCKHHAIDCTFEQLASRRSATSGARASGGETISNRIKRIEHALLSAQGSGLGEGLSSLAGLQILPQSQTRDSRAKIYFAGHYVGHIGSFTGIPFISATGKAWIEDCIGQKGPVDKICNIGPDWQASAAEHRPYSCVDNDQGCSKQAEFPSRRTVEHLLALYFSSGFSKFLYIVDPTLFKRALNAAYASPTTANAGARAHVLAFVLMTNQVQHELPGPSIDTVLCETLLGPLFPQILGEPDSSSPATFLMLMVYYVSHGKEEQGLICHSVACRHLFSLGAHVHPAHRSDRTGSSDDEDNISELAEQHLRRLFWIAYWCDGELSVRTGRPPAIDEDYCDLTLPTEPDDDHHMGSNSSLKMALDPRDTAGEVGFGVADLQLSMITARIGRRLYSASALRKTDAEILCAVRELDDELERWRNLIPEPRRPTLASDQSYVEAEDSTIKLDLEMRSSVRQLNYLHLVMIVHQASSRCRQWAKDTESRHLQGISSSIAISLHASRATLGHMSYVSFHDSVGNIWTVLFFPIAAALNIFCNILLDPLSPSAEGDLELISSTSDLIRRITTRSKGHGDAAWFPHLDIFVTELARLGRMAVNRANGRTKGLDLCV